MSPRVAEYVAQIQKATTRADAALIYAKAFAEFGFGHDVNPWPPIERVVMDRWRETGLSYVRKRAWTQTEMPFPETASAED